MEKQMLDKHGTDQHVQTLLSSVWLILGAGTAAIVLFVIGIFCINQSNVELGGYGSYIGGILGTVLSFITVILVYKTFYLQKSELKLQREELGKTHDAMQSQQFETGFYQSLGLLRSITEELVIPYIHFTREVNEGYEKYERVQAFQHIHASLVYYTQHLTDEMKLLLRESMHIHYSMNDELTEDNLEVFVKADISREQYFTSIFFRMIMEKTNGLLDTFLQTFEFILEDIDRYSGDRLRYAGLLRAQLGHFQLVVLFYDALDKPRLHHLLEKYRMLEKIDERVLLQKSHTRFYPNSVFNGHLFSIIQDVQAMDRLFS